MYYPSVLFLAELASGPETSSAPAMLHSGIQGLSAVPSKQLGTDELVLWGFCSF